MNRSGSIAGHLVDRRSPTSTSHSRLQDPERIKGNLEPLLVQIERNSINHNIFPFLPHFPSSPLACLAIASNSLGSVPEPVLSPPDDIKLVHNQIPNLGERWSEVVQWPERTQQYEPKTGTAWLKGPRMASGEVFLSGPVEGRRNIKWGKCSEPYQNRTFGRTSEHTIVMFCKWP